MSQQRNGGFYCLVRACHNRSKDRQVSFFRLPKERSNLWLTECNREDLVGKTTAQLAGYRICARHFEDKMFANYLKNRLLPTAIPSIFPFTSTKNCPEDVELEQSETTLPRAIIHSDISTDSVQSTSGAMDMSEVPVKPSALSNISIDPVQSTSSAMDMSEVPVNPSALLSAESSLVEVVSLNSSAETQTTPDLSSYSPRRDKLKRKIKTLQRKLRLSSTGGRREKKGKKMSIEEFHEVCLQFLPKELADFVKIRAELNLHDPKGRRYNAEYRKLALSLYFLGPQAYKFFKKLFYLPSVRSLERITKEIKFTTGLDNDVLFETLKIKSFGFPTDEMSLKSNLFYNIGRDEIIGMKDLGGGEIEFIPAQNATVIMARGLYSNWKQPIAYFFVHSCMTAKELEINLKKCIQKMEAARLIVVCTVNDMGSNFIQLANNLGVTRERPSFKVGDSEIIYFFDTG